MGRSASTLALISVAVLVAALDQTVVVTALPEVMADIGIPITRLDDASWIITGYLLGYTVAMPLMGRMSDAHGHTRMFVVALAVFAVGSLGVALSHGLAWTVASRVVQAVGGGATVPIGLAIARETAPPRREGLAIGLVAGSAEAGSVLGPIYGGAIITALGWRWIFWLNLPLCALLALALLRAPRVPGTPQRVDYAGGLLLGGALLLFSLGLGQREVFRGLASPLPYLALAGGLGVSALLALVERRHENPILSPSMLSSPAFLSANATQLLVGAGLIIALVNVPLMSDTVMGQEPMEGGLRLVRLTGAIPPGAVLGGFLLSYLGARALTVLGLLLTALGFYLISGWPVDVSEPYLSLHLALTGLGFGLVISPITGTAMGALPGAHRGTAASIVTVARLVGMTLGLSAMSAWGMGHFQMSVAGLEAPIPLPDETAEEFARRVAEYQQAITQAGMDLFRLMFRAGMGVSLAGAVTALFMRMPRDTEGEQGQVTSP